MLIVPLEGRGWDWDEAYRFVSNLEEELTRANPGALAELQRYTRDGLSEVKAGVLLLLQEAMNNSSRRHLTWQPNGSSPGSHMVLCALSGLPQPHQRLSMRVRGIS